MKELSIEQKAKCYDEALERAKGVIEQNPLMEYLKKGIEYIFPELKESKDVKIKKVIFKALLSDEAINILVESGIYYEDIESWLEKQGKQKHTDIVEPKFKVGDIITNGIIIGKVDENENNKYHGWFGYDKDLNVHYADIPDVENWHLWTIQDAKDGDVIYDGHEACIFRKTLKDDDAIWIDVYCGININNEFKVNDEDECWCLSSYVCPATKEQRDLLFQKMSEAGYEWSAEKKELKKIEQKPVENKGMNLVEEEMTPFQKKVFCIIDTTIEEEQGLKQVCDELFALASNEIKQKPAWSEEDKLNLNQAIYVCHQNGYTAVENWLKSLKQRIGWKPSEEQMDALHYVTNFDYGGHKATLVSLYEQLKKLREG